MSIQFEKRVKPIYFRPKKVNEFLYSIIIPRRFLGSGFVNKYLTMYDIYESQMRPMFVFQLTAESELYINNKKIPFSDYLDYYNSEKPYIVDFIFYSISLEKSKIYINLLKLKII